MRKGKLIVLNRFGNFAHAGTLEAAGDIEIDQLRRRLVETEAAMERIVARMGNLSRSVMHISSPQSECKVHCIPISKFFFFLSIVFSFSTNVQTLHVAVFFLLHFKAFLS